MHGPGIRREVAGDQVEQRRFARTVRPDDAKGLALGHLKLTSSVTFSWPKLFETFLSSRIGHIHPSARIRAA
jgi:hypothetical protein